MREILAERVFKQFAKLTNAVGFFFLLPFTATNERVPVVIRSNVGGGQGNEIRDAIIAYSPGRRDATVRGKKTPRVKGERMNAKRAGREKEATKRARLRRGLQLPPVRRRKDK